MANFLYIYIFFKVQYNIPINIEFYILNRYELYDTELYFNKAIKNKNLKHERNND